MEIERPGFGPGLDIVQRDAQYLASAGRQLEALAEAIFRLVVMRGIVDACLETGVDFRLASIPQDLDLGTASLDMPRDEQERIVNAGPATPLAGLEGNDVLIGHLASGLKQSLAPPHPCPTCGERFAGER